MKTPNTSPQHNLQRYLNPEVDRRSALGLAGLFGGAIVLGKTTELFQRQGPDQAASSQAPPADTPPETTNPKETEDQRCEQHKPLRDWQGIAPNTVSELKAMKDEGEKRQALLSLIALNGPYPGFETDLSDYFSGKRAGTASAVLNQIASVLSFCEDIGMDPQVPYGREIAREVVNTFFEKPNSPSSGVAAFQENIERCRLLLTGFCAAPEQVQKERGLVDSRRRFFGDTTVVLVGDPKPTNLIHSRRTPKGYPVSEEYLGLRIVGAAHREGESKAWRNIHVFGLVVAQRDGGGVVIKDICTRYPARLMNDVLGLSDRQDFIGHYVETGEAPKR